MKWSATIYILISITSVNAQQWKTVSGSVEKFYIENDSALLSNNLIYRKDKKFIVIEKPAEKDFTRLFTDDSSAFDIIYNKCPQNPFWFHYDTLVCSLLGAGESDEVVDLYNRRVESGKHTIKWFLQSSLMSSPPGCYKTITLRRIRKDKRWVLKIADIIGYCLIP